MSMDTAAGVGALPLSRYRVIDLTRVRAGPTAVRQFADWGADVILVDAVEGRSDVIGTRHTSDFQNLNRNKRSIKLNLKEPDGRRILHDLARSADVLFENFRPDVKHRLGIDYETLANINPRLVYVSISGFGQSGPYRDRPGLDQIAQGMGGLMSVTGEPGKGPMRAGIAVADSTAGLYAALGAMTALLARESSGKGAWVRTSLLQAQIAMLDFQAARWLVDRSVPEQVGNEHPTAVPMGMYRSADGIVNVAASGKILFERFCKAAEREDLAREERLQGNGRVLNRAALSKEIASIIATRPSAYWIEKLNAAGVPCGPVYTIDQVFADPQVQHLEMTTSVTHPQLGQLELVGQPIEIGDVDPTARRPAPDAGEHSKEILRELGYSTANIESLAERGVI